MKIVGFDIKTYKKESVFKAIYAVSHRYALKVVTSNEEYSILIESPNLNDKQISTLKDSLINSVNDQELRFLVEAETKEVKLLLLAKALSSGGIYDDVAEKIWK